MSCTDGFGVRYEFDDDDHDGLLSVIVRLKQDRHEILFDDAIDNDNIEVRGSVMFESYYGETGWQDKAPLYWKIAYSLYHNLLNNPPKEFTGEIAKLADWKHHEIPATPSYHLVEVSRIDEAMRTLGL